MAGALTSKSLLEELLRVSSSRCREQNLLEGMLPAWSLRSFCTSGRDWAALRLASTLQSLLKELVRAAAHFRVAGGIYATARFVRQAHHAKPQLSCGRRRRSSSVRERRWDAAGFRVYRMALSIILLLRGRGGIYGTELALMAHLGLRLKPLSPWLLA